MQRWPWMKQSSSRKTLGFTGRALLLFLVAGVLLSRTNELVAKVYTNLGSVYLSRYLESYGPLSCTVFELSEETCTREWPPHSPLLNHATDLYYYALQNHDGQTNRVLGQLAWLRDDVGEAEQLFLQAPADEQDLAWFFLGNLYLSQGNHERAIWAYRRAGEQNLSTGLLRHANERVRQGDRDAAIAILNYAIEIRPGFYDGYIRLADLYVGDNRDSEARDMLEEALGLAQQPSAEYYGAVGRAAYIDKEWNTAIEAFRKGLQYEPSSTRLWHDLGKAYRKQEKPLLAVHSLRQAVAIDPHDFWSYMALGATCRDLAAPGEAEVYYLYALDNAYNSSTELRARIELIEMYIDYCDEEAAQHQLAIAANSQPQSDQILRLLEELRDRCDSASGDDPPHSP